MALRRRTPRTECSAPPLVSSLTFDGHLVLIDGAASRLFLYNETAGLIWNGLARGRDAAGLVDEISARHRVPSERVRADVAIILDHWVAEGLIEPHGVSASARRAAPEGTKAVGDDAGQSNDPAQQPERWACAIRGQPIEFEIEGTECVALVRRMFAHLETPGVQPRSRISIRQMPSARYSLAVEGRERLRTDNSGLLIGGLYQALLERIHPGIEWLALIHGGAIARDGVAVALPAPSGSGKTTLLAYLMTQGFRYLTDDLVALAAPDGLLVPWPVPLSVKSGSWDVLMDQHPQMSEGPTFLARGIEARLLLPPQEAWDARHTPVRAIIFPRYDPAAAGDLQPISSIEALQQLLADRIWLGHPLAEHRVQAFLGWLKAIPAYRLTYKRLDQALRGIEKALSS